jgi:hypothetical protein
VAIGGHAPDEEPVVPDGGHFFITAFWRLSSGRVVTEGLLGRGAGEIPWRDIHAYAEYEQLDATSEWVLEHIISELDAEYLSVLRDMRRERAPGAGGTGPRSPGGGRGAGGGRLGSGR